MKLVLGIVGLTLAFTASVYGLASLAGTPAARTTTRFSPPAVCSDAVAAERAQLVGTYHAGADTLVLRHDGRFTLGESRPTRSLCGYGSGHSSGPSTSWWGREGHWMPSGTKLLLTDLSPMTIVEHAGGLALCEAGTRLWTRL